MVCRSTEQGTEILFKEGGATMVLGTVSEVVKKLNGPVLTKREQFAAMAMQGFSSCEMAQEEFSVPELAVRARIFADLMINELQNP
jgi:hypothetical protein